MSTEIHIMTLDIQNEMDVMLAHRRAMQFAKYSGLSLPEQTRFATAVSEISRNSMEYAVNGSIKFSIGKIAENSFLSAVIKDEGKGISGLPEILNRNPESYRGRGLGIVFAKRLADDFRIASNAKGTTVQIKKHITAKTPVISNIVVQGWIKHLANEPVISAYEELKMRNLQLVELTEELRSNAEMVEKQMEDIKLLNERLSSSNERMKEFTYAISHDLKTPLSSLKLSSDYLEANPAGKDTPVYQGIVTRAIKRLDRTIHSLIEIIDVQDEEKHKIRDIDFNTLFLESLDEHKEMISNTQATLHSDFSNAPSITYIEGYLQSVFRNMLSNSLKYRDPDKPLEITVNTRKLPRRIILSFSDNGIGMDLEKIKDRLFVPFNRFSKQSEGKGIGLYLVKSMVENNGGSVSVESAIGKGTTFTFYLRPYS